MNHRTLTMTNLLNLTHTTRQRSSSSTSRLPLAWHDQRIVLGFAEPDPNSKIYCAFSPAKAGLRSDQRAPSSAPFKGNAVLEYGPTEILPPIGANWKTLRVSADRVAKPAARKAGFSTFEGGCGRETDSPLEEAGFELSVP